uniref:Uncharacterized protein n=1 Tax=Ditylenchus dipsaci TaxID=166011 RepID=A0A915EAL1_9BILA
MSLRSKGKAATEKSPSAETAKETGTMSPISGVSSPQTFIGSAEASPLSVAPSESHMQTIQDYQSLGTSRSSIFNRKSSVCQSATAETASIRLSTSILLLLSMNVCLVIASRLTLWNFVVSRMLASLLAPFVAFFGYQWCHYYSIALTRKKRAFWCLEKPKPNAKPKPKVPAKAETKVKHKKPKFGRPKFGFVFSASVLALAGTFGFGSDFN